jgi:hypothetical protein
LEKECVRQEKVARITSASQNPPGVVELMKKKKILSTALPEDGIFIRNMSQ